MNPQTKNFANESRYGRIIQHENGIVYFYMNDGLLIDVADAKQMVADTRAIANPGPIRLLFVYGKNGDLTFKAQRYFASVTGFSRLAFIVHTRLQAEVGQFLVILMRTLKSSYEFRMFYDESQAEAWLQQA